MPLQQSLSRITEEEPYTLRNKAEIMITNFF